MHIISNRSSLAQYCIYEHTHTHKRVHTHCDISNSVLLILVPQLILLAGTICELLFHSYNFPEGV